MTISDRSETPVDALSERFWEAILELNPVTATVYGDDRYDDRLDDPGPRARGDAQAHGADAGGDRGYPPR